MESIFVQIKGQITARAVAEGYGLKVRRNGMACCPFHNDKHPSMKIDKIYHCFACGVGGDAIDYVSRMYGLSQYNAALKLIEDFHLPIEIKGKRKLDTQERERIQKEKQEREKVVRIKARFQQWCSQTIELLKNSITQVKQVGIFLMDKLPTIVFSEDYAQMLHAEPFLYYWLDILCMGTIEEKQELFLNGRKEVECIVGTIRTCGKCIMEQNRRSI